MWQIALVIGRETELARVREVLRDASAGRAGALVIQGDAGVGKSTLLAESGRVDLGLRRVLVVGVPAEHDLPYAALHALLGPLLTPEVLTQLPPHQRTALRTALGIDASPAPSRLLLGAAVLGVLAASGPLCLLIDDLQWLDQPSADALLFAARRLRAEQVALVATVRTTPLGDASAQAPDTAGLAVLRLEGLADLGSAATLLPAVHPHVVRTLFEATAGNPLAMVEIAAGLTAQEAEGAVPLPATLPTSRPEQLFAARLETLPPRARLATRVAALAGAASREVLADALARGGLELADTDGLVALRLCRIDASVTWRHPLVAAAAARGGTREGRQVHGWLADAYRGRNPSASAWHRAESLEGHDEQASSALQDVARTAEGRGASADAADAWQRASALHPDASARARLVERAAAAALRAGATRRAAALIDEALLQQPGPEAAARLLWRRGRIQHTLGDPRRALELLLQAADLGKDPTLRVWASAEALYAAMYAGALDQVERTAGLVRLAADPTDPVHRFLSAHAAGAAHALLGRPTEARAAMDDARRLLTASLLESEPALTLWAVNLEIFDPVEPQLSPAVLDAIGRMRSAGDLTWLPRVTHLAASREADAGRWPQALALMEECELLSHMSGQHTQLAEALLQLAELDALRGDTATAGGRLARVTHILQAAEVPWLSRTNEWVQGLMAMSIGDWDRAALLLADVARTDVTAVVPAVEAALRCGGPERVRALLPCPDEASGPVRLRVEALLDTDEAAGALRLVELLEPGAPPIVLALERVAIGERLRRAGRRTLAREQLRAALDFFQGISAEPWVQRVEEELRASGATLRRRDEGALLTASERRVAVLAAEGLRNKDVASTLFLSPKTVEFHLGNAYRKLGVSNRTALARALEADRGDGDSSP